MQCQLHTPFRAGERSRFHSQEGEVEKTPPITLSAAPAPPPIVDIDEVELVPCPGPVGGRGHAPAKLCNTPVRVLRCERHLTWTIMKREGPEGL